MDSFFSMSSPLVCRPHWIPLAGVLCCEWLWLAVLPWRHFEWSSFLPSLASGQVTKMKLESLQSCSSLLTYWYNEALMAKVQTTLTSPCTPLAAGPWDHWLTGSGNADKWLLVSQWLQVPPVVWYFVLHTFERWQDLNNLLCHELGSLVLPSFSTTICSTKCSS